MTPADSQTLAILAHMAPDTGRIQISPKYHLDTYQALHWPNPENTCGLVAQWSHINTLIGAGLVTNGQAQFKGKQHAYALLHNLMVHPDHRNQGVASQLARKRIEYAQRISPESYILAFIQQGNESSLAVANKWHDHLAGPIVSQVVTLRSSPPQSHEKWVVRPPTEIELSTIAQQLNHFYADYDLYTTHTDDCLATWLTQSPFETPYRHYRIVTDANGQIRAGLAVTEGYRLKSMQIDQVPRLIRWLNKIIKLVPANNQLQQATVTKAWFAKGHQQAGQFLWESVRWEWYKQANALLVMFDPRSNLTHMFKAPFWLPRSHFYLACSQVDALTDDRLIYIP